VPSLGNAFSLSAWVAVNNYPWNRVPILDQSAENQVGYFFGMDAFGHINFDVDRIKKALLEIGTMRPGSLTRQYKDPQHHTGPTCRSAIPAR
jgi:hypothetical protein